MSSVTPISLLHPYTAAGKLVLPGDAKVVPVDRGGGLEADPPHRPAVLAVLPEGRLPLPEVRHVQGHLRGVTSRSVSSAKAL